LVVEFDAYTARQYFAFAPATQRAAMFAAVKAPYDDAISEIRRLWDEGIKSGPSRDLDVSAIKMRGGQRLQADRK
jgi:hypothetical protein